MEKSLFDLEVRDKKNQAYLNRAKTGARGGSSSRKGMRTPFDYMSAKERKKLSGEVQVTNMYTTILNWKEFILKDKETQKELLTKWREVHSNYKIMEELGIGRERPFNSQSYADLVNGLGCPKKTRQVHPDPATKKPRRNAVAKPVIKLDEKPTLLELAIEAEEVINKSKQEAEPEQPKVTPILITNGLHLEYHGEYDSEQLSKIFTKLQLLTDGEPHKFKISLSLTECEK
jgi:hypothetical protein